MTDNELNKLARLQAMYLAEELKGNRELLDKVFPPKLMDIDEAADYLRIKKKTVYMKIREIPHSKIGRSLVFNQRDLAEYAGSKRESAEPTMEIVGGVGKRIV